MILKEPLLTPAKNGGVSKRPCKSLNANANLTHLAYAIVFYMQELRSCSSCAFSSPIELKRCSSRILWRNVTFIGRP